MQDKLAKIIAEVERYKGLNRPLAVEEPANDFEGVINTWDEAQQLATFLKGLIKSYVEAEKKQRDAIVAVLNPWLEERGELKEGVNNYELSNGRALKYTYAIERKVDTPSVAIAREAYKEAATVGDPAFDELLRIKYELEVKPFRKLSEEASKAVSRMVTAKPKSAELEVD